LTRLALRTRISATLLLYERPYDRGHKGTAHLSVLNSLDDDGVASLARRIADNFLASECSAPTNAPYVFLDCV
jgi:hypothetical protein